jgi:serine protein kinase
MNQINLLAPNVTPLRSKKQKDAQPEAAADAKAQVVSAGKNFASAPAGLHKVYFAGLEDAQKVAKTAIDVSQFEKEIEVLSWNDYLKKVFNEPRVSQDSYQRIYDMIMSRPKHDTGKVTDDGDKIFSYEFFTDPENGDDSISGMDEPLHEFVQAMKAAARGTDIRNRFFMFEGPVGTAKSTIMTLIKRGLEKHSRTDGGAMYSLRWDNIPEEVATDRELQLSKHPKTGQYFYDEPMNDDPLRVIPDEFGQRKNVLKEVNANFAKLSGGRAPYEISLRGGLSPASELVRQKLMEYYKDKLGPDETLMDKVSQHVKARRMVMDETKRVGIATYMPKDPKNQDSTELNGDIDYSKLPMYGDPNHPLVQAYKGEFNIANRGVMEFVEILKLQREFLYDLLTAAQERRIKPKNGTLIPIDMVIIGHTNMEELDEKLKDGKMKAFFNRAVEIRVPYLLDYKGEMEIYKKGFVKQAAKQGINIAPHAIETAAKWAVLTRRDPQIVAAAESAANANDSVGLYGTSPRFLQAAFSQVLVHSQVEESGTVSPFIVLRSINRLLKKGMIKDNKNLPRYHALLDAVKEDLTRNIQQDILKTYMDDKEALRNYLHKYVKSLQIWRIDPSRADEAFLRRVELKLKAPVAAAAVREYRDNLLLKLDAMDDKPVTLDLLEEDPSFKQALAAVMFEDLKNKLDGEEIGKLAESLKKLGYNEASAKEAIQHITTPGGIV